MGEYAEKIVFVRGQGEIIVLCFNKSKNKGRVSREGTLVQCTELCYSKLKMKVLYSRYSAHEVFKKIIGVYKYMGVKSNSNTIL